MIPAPLPGLEDGTGVTVPGGLQEPRFGHRQVRIPGLGVLLVGGLSRVGGVLRTNRGAELYIPRSSGSKERDPLGREPGDVFDELRICPTVDELP